MDNLMKVLLTSGVLSAVAGGVVGWLATSYKIERELHSRQSESGYEALVNANVLLWQSNALRLKAKQEGDELLATEAAKMRRQSHDLEVVAQLKIATFGDDRVVNAMADYYSKHVGADVPCGDMERTRAEMRMYQAIRSTLGAGGNVSDQQLAHIINQCDLELP